jgi:ABC-2 type transport system permease protein
MVAHVLKYRLKCFFRDRQMMFWTLLFPLLLATLFHLAFANLVSIEKLISIRIAVVDNEAYRQDQSFQAALAAVSTADESGNRLFEVTIADVAEAAQMLKENKIDGYIEQDSSLRLVVRSTGLNQNIIKSFLDDYSQTKASVEEIIMKNPASIQSGILDAVQKRTDYLEDTPDNGAAGNPAVIYFYSLIAMTALYGGFWGMRVVTDLQANQSPQGARICVAPVHKMALLLIDILAALVIQFAIILILVAYIGLILGYEVGSQLGMVILTALAGCFMGVSFGACIAALIKQREGIKSAILISASMLMSFLSGMMYHGIKYLVIKAVPILAWLNPANIMTDAFYALYYGNSSRCALNIVGLLVFGAVFCAVAYSVLRRQKYASI